MKKTQLILFLFLGSFISPNISAFAQEAYDYAYNSNGNLITDTNKEIALRYNHLNLADTILYEDDHKVIYTYSSTG
jgi:hypothetical protein